MKNSKRLLVGILSGGDEPPPVELDAVLAWRDARVDLLAFDCLANRGLAHLWPSDDTGMADRQLQAVALDTYDAAVVRQVLEILHTAGVDGLILKGWALAHTHYTRPWLRARSDLDLLVPLPTLDRVADAVAGLGFIPQPEVTDPLISTQRHFSRATPSPFALDIHGTLVNPHVLRTLPAWEELRERAVPVPALGPLAFALSAPDALLHALVHRVAHHNSTTDALWLYDVHLLAGGLDADGWAAFVAATRRAAVCAIAFEGLQVATRELGTAVPAIVGSTLRAATAEPSAALMGGRLTEWRLQWINFRSLGSTTARIRFVRAHVLPPRHLVEGADARWRRPLAYGRRLMRGVRKWLTPIGQGR